MSIVPPHVPRKSPRSKVALIGCAVAILIVLLCAGAGVAIYFGACGAVEAVQEQERFAQQWTPPAADAPPETFAPENVAGFMLASADEQAEFPALGIEQAGSHAVYRKDADTVEVSVYRMTEDEKTAIFDEVIRRIDDDERFQSNSHVRLPRSLQFSVKPPELHGSLWHSQGWLVFVRSSTVKDLEPFQRAYLDAVKGQN